MRAGQSSLSLGRHKPLRLACKEAWARAYRRTPHEKPVELADAAD
jgi:hypothetical protein